MMRLVRDIICAILICEIAFPASAFAGFHGPTQSAVILPVVGDSAGEGAQFATELSNSLARDFGAVVNTIDAKTLSQSNKGVDTKGLALGYQSYFKSLAEAKNRYSLEGNARIALSDLDVLAEELLNHDSFDQEISKIYETCRLSKAWIEYQSGQKSAAAKTVLQLASSKRDQKINTVGYPGTFLRFVSKTIQDGQFPIATLDFETKPRSVDVFLNGIYAGDSSSVIQVPAGKNVIHLAASGRRTVKRQLTLTEGTRKTLKSALAWTRKGGQSAKAQLPTDTLESISLSAALNQGVRADKIVLLSINRADGGYKIAARVYDQNFHQPFATIQYPKTIRNIKKDSLKLHQFLENRLRPYLSKPANKLWKGDYDRDIVLDDRIASRPREPIYRKPAFWAVVGGVVVGGVVLGMALANGGSSSGGGSGSVVVDISGFRGATR